MSLLRVDLRKGFDRSYDVQIARGVRQNLVDEICEIESNKKFAVISDSKVAKLYGKDLIEELKGLGVECELFSFPVGEKSKNWEMAGKLARKLIVKGFSRTDMIVALGGGVTGDLAGFVAAVFMRGISFVQVPTSLLAMTDAAIGGKTGVNVPEGKNLLGAFCQPDKVYVDVNFLETLSKKEMQNGYAEIVKHAVIGDKKLFKLMEKATDRELFEDLDFVNSILLRSCKVKTKIVSQDERESKVRMHLNLGHTIGHAVEKEMEYKLAHGRAVSIGLAKVCDIAVNKKVLSAKTSLRIKNVLSNIGLPLGIPKKIAKSSIVKSMAGDKKVKNKKLNFILPVRIGKVVIDDSVGNDEVLAVL